MTQRDTIEFEEPRFSTCECCGEETVHLVRFVSRDGNAFAVYFADFSNGHKYVSVLVSIGGWGSDDDTPEDRTAFAFRIWASEDNYQVGLVDEADSFYSSGYMGRILDRQEALAHPLRQEVFDLSDHIVECDQPVIDFLSQVAADDRD